MGSLPGLPTPNHDDLVKYPEGHAGNDLYLSTNSQCPAAGQYLCADRPGLHHGLRHADHDQFRPRRPVHGRRLFLFSSAPSISDCRSSRRCFYRMLGVACLGVVIERLAYKPLRNAPRVSAIITALGVGIFLENFTLALCPYPQAHPAAVCTTPPGIRLGFPSPRCRC